MRRDAPEYTTQQMATYKLERLRATIDYAVCENKIDFLSFCDEFITLRELLPVAFPKANDQESFITKMSQFAEETNLVNSFPKFWCIPAFKREQPQFIDSIG